MGQASILTGPVSAVTDHTSSTSNGGTSRQKCIYVAFNLLGYLPGFTDVKRSLSARPRRLSNVCLSVCLSRPLP